MTNDEEGPDKPDDHVLEAHSLRHVVSVSADTVELTVYEATAGVATSITERKAILEAAGVFQGLDDQMLSVYAHDSEPIGPRIGVTGAPESTLKAAAGHADEARKRCRDAKQARADRTTTIVLAVGGWVVAVLIAVLAVLLQ